MGLGFTQDNRSLNWASMFADVSEICRTMGHPQHPKMLDLQVPGHD